MDRISAEVDAARDAAHRALTEAQHREDLIADARLQAEEEQRGRELIAGLVTIAAAATVGTVAVLIADQITGMHLVADLIRWVRS